MSILASISVSQRSLVCEIYSLDNLVVQLDILYTKKILSSVEVRLTIFDKIQSHQFEEKRHCIIHDQFLSGESKRATMDSRGFLRFNGCICVSWVGYLIQSILCETHSSRYSMQLDTNSIYRDLRQLYRWSSTKRDM